MTCDLVTCDLCFVPAGFQWKTVASGIRLRSTFGVIFTETIFLKSCQTVAGKDYHGWLFQRLFKPLQGT